MTLSMRQRRFAIEAAVWIALAALVGIATKFVSRSPALTEAARTTEGCVQWAEQHDDEELARKCRAHAPIQELLDHVAQTRHAQF